MFIKYVYVFLVYGLILDVKSTDFVIKFENDLNTHNGFGWPPVVHVAKGNEALIKLSTTLDSPELCTVTAPSGLRFDVMAPPSNKYQKWTDGCGARVKNIKFDDEGRWRLTATKGNDSITGWVELYVLEDRNTYKPPPIALKDGETHTKVELSSIENSYCVVAKPFSEGSLVPGQCSLTLDRTTRAVQGNWDVLLGLPGRVAELHTKQHVIVESERLDVGYVRDEKNKLHLYCNILHTSKEITFCRFQRTSTQFGYNVIDGLSDGSHSYYGEGFALKQCGMTIEKPTARDYGTWRCSVGVQMMVGNEMQQQTPMQALISVPSSDTFAQPRQSDEQLPRTIFVQEDTPFTITCQAQVPLHYCWFQHPNGSQFTPVNLVDKDQLFWYTGENLNLGDCGITFAHSTKSDSGIWSCHMGPRSNIGIEVTDQVEVRVTGALAAHKKEVSVEIGQTATLYCHSANGRRPLKYCRFLSPTSLGMSLDASIKEENAILNRYYFTPERDLNIGDCSLSILSIHNEDIGKWTCAAVVDDELLESRDTIKVHIGGPSGSPQFQAGIIGMSLGIVVLVVVLIGYLSFKRGWIRSCTQLGRSGNQGSHISEDISLQTRSGSMGSSSSGNSSNNNETILRRA